MAEVIKTLCLHRHADKTPCGRHISASGRSQARAEGKEYDRAYGTNSINHVFFGPLIRTTETAFAMIANRFAFDEATIHDAVDGLGSDALFKAMVNDDFMKGVKLNGLSNLEAAKAAHSDDVIAGFISDGVHAIRLMFGLMDDGQTGVGIFHDPTIPMIAEALGMEDARSLDSMEGMTFRLYDDDTIVASWD